MSDSPVAAATRPPSFRDAFRRGTKVHDVIAAVPLVAWYGLCASTQISALRTLIPQLYLSGFSFALAAGVLAKSAAVLFAIAWMGLLLARRPARSAPPGALPRIAAVLGTYLAVSFSLLPAPNPPLALLILSTVLILAGVAFALYSLMHLGRSLSIMPEARALVTSGPYSVIRHPLYLGEEISIFGLAIQFLSGWAMLILAVQIACQLYRMHYEEGVLSDNFPQYALYKARTFRLVPGLY